MNTSHAEGTLNLLTGRYLAYRELSAVSDRLEPTEPTLFEYLRRAYDIPSHQVLLINGEDRPQEEFFTFGAGDHFGIEFRSEMLSLHRYKLYRTAMQLAEGKLPEDQLLKVQEERATLLTQDPRGSTPDPSPEVTAFWARWRQGFGDSRFKYPRGDRLLTELSVRSLADLKPRLMMVNYQDPDYVHWGNASHYTRAIAIIDEGRIIENDRMSTVLRKLQTETFVLNLRGPLRGTLSLPGYRVTAPDETTLEVEVNKEQNLNEIFVALTAAGGEVVGGDTCQWPEGVTLESSSTMQAARLQGNGAVLGEGTGHAITRTVRNTGGLTVM